MEPRPALSLSKGGPCGCSIPHPPAAWQLADRWRRGVITTPLLRDARDARLRSDGDGVAHVVGGGEAEGVDVALGGLMCAVLRVHLAGANGVRKTMVNGR